MFNNQMLCSINIDELDKLDISNLIKIFIENNEWRMSIFTLFSYVDCITY